jgi:hypothetical protein
MKYCDYNKQKEVVKDISVIPKKCCGEEMDFDDCVQSMDWNAQPGVQWVCRKCGSKIEIWNVQMDDEELQNYIWSNPRREDLPTIEEYAKFEEGADKGKFSWHEDARKIAKATGLDEEKVLAIQNIENLPEDYEQELEEYKRKKAEEAEE